MRRRTVQVGLAAAALTAALSAATLLPGADDPADTAGTAASPPPELVEARAEAALRRCPQPPPGRSGEDGTLSGVRATCLGDGRPIDLGAALNDRPMLIHVWSAGCAPCEQQLSVVDEYATSAEAVPVIGVQVHGDPFDGLTLLTRRSVRLATVHDTTGAVDRALNVPENVPVNYLLDPDGTVHRLDPPTPWTSGTQVQATVDGHLAQHT
jgi:thiol-disulfide isomerase/thioredoxin